MPVWCVTGKLGSGKTLVSVSRIKKYLEQGRRVATNLDLNLENLVDPWAKKTVVYRLPDIPSVEDLETIGLGYDGKLQGDEKNGLIVLDELAKWLNSRNWNDKSRKGLIDFFVHLRKRRWDCILIIQDIEALDKQFKDLYCEHIVYCSRSDRYNIPIIGSVYKLFWGERLPLPKIHIGNVYYNLGIGKQTHIENWIYRGTTLYDAYDTEQSFNTEDSPNIYEYLPPWHIKGRYVSRADVIKESLKNLKLSHFFLVGIISGLMLSMFWTPDGNDPDRGLFSCNADWKLYDPDCSLSKEDLKQAIVDFKNPQTQKVNDSLHKEVKEDTNTSIDIDDVYISGSVGYGSEQYDYVFHDASGATYYPYEHGFKVYDISECKAMMVNLENPEQRRTVFCKR